MLSFQFFWFIFSCSGADRVQWEPSAGHAGSHGCMSVAVRVWGRVSPDTQALCSYS